MITNLSVLSGGARRALLAKSDEEEICFTWNRRLSGEFVTPERPLTQDERSKITELGVAVLSAGAIALAGGCVSTAAHTKTAQKPLAEQKTFREQKKAVQAQLLPNDETHVSQVFGVVNPAGHEEMNELNAIATANGARRRLRCSTSRGSALNKVSGQQWRVF